MYTDGLSEEKKLLSNGLNKNLMQKAYSKKWIDDISDLNLGLNPLNLLNDSVNIRIKNKKEKTRNLFLIVL